MLILRKIFYLLQKITGKQLMSVLFAKIAFIVFIPLNLGDIKHLNI